MLWRVAGIVFLMLSPVISAGSDNHLFSGPTYQSICYHGVGDEVFGNYDPDEMEVSTQNLFNQFTWLKEHGYTPVRIQDILDAERGLRPLPEKAILLTFDDGLKSFYTRVFPMLKLFRFPAAAAVVGAWIEPEKDTEVEYAGETLGPEDFMSWAQLREVSESGLVDVISHSFNLHRGGLANGFGSKLPMAIVRLYDKKTGAYESDAAYYRRIYADLKKSADQIEEKVGKRPIAIAWPYGKFNRTTIEISKSLGMEASMVLDKPLNYVFDPRWPGSERIGRHLMVKNPDLDKVVYSLHHPYRKATRRMIRISLDEVFNEDEKVMRKNIDTLLDRVRAMETADVILKVWSDDDGDGAADGLYFPNRHLPMKADLFNFISWQIKTRCGTNVYAHLPVTAWEFPVESEVAYLKSTSGESRVPRVSIFHPVSRETVLQLYEDLAAAGDFAGLVFGQDAYMAEDEDAGPAALDWYASQWGMPGDVEAIRADPKLLSEWSRLKTRFLSDFTLLLHKRAERYCAPLETIRNVAESALVEEESMRKYSQFYPAIVKEYDYAMVTVAPTAKREMAIKRYLQNRVKLAVPYDRTMWKTIFELPSLDPATQGPVPADVMVRRMRWIAGAGSFQLSYGPDNFLENQPDLKTIRHAISIETFAYD